MNCNDQLILEITQGRTTVGVASRQFDLPPAEIESWWRMASAAWRTHCGPNHVREQYERQLKDLQEAYGEAMLEIRARKKLASLLGKDES